MSAAMALNPVLGKLVSKRVVLASASPRRQEILTNVVSAAPAIAAPPCPSRRCPRGWGVCVCVGGGDSSHVNA